MLGSEEAEPRARSDEIDQAAQPLGGSAPSHDPCGIGASVDARQRGLEAPAEAGRQRHPEIAIRVAEPLRVAEEQNEPEAAA